MLRRLKRLARALGGRPAAASGAPEKRRGEDRAAYARGEERAASYYDEVFRSNSHFLLPFYESPYYPTWLLIADRLRRYGCKAILDIGSGPGQFAELMDDAGFPSYLGVDFSDEAVEQAQRRAPRFRFAVGDARSSAVYEDTAFDAIVCMEVLEHVEEDLAIVSNMPTGIRCLMTVPNFPFRSHVRHFDDEDSVLSRYGRFFDDPTVTRLKGVRTANEQFFLLDGIRNTVMA
jgi:SAM-dependent methyltransferase